MKSHPADWEPPVTDKQRLDRAERRIKDLERKHAQQIDLISEELAALNRRLDAAQPTPLDAETDSLPRTHIWSTPRF